MAGLGIGPSGRFAVISSVVTPAADRNLTTLATVKVELGVFNSETDSVLTRYIAEASFAAENYCNRVFSVQTVKDQFFPSREVPMQAVVGGVDPIQLTCWPVTAISSVKEDGEVLVEGEDFYVDKAKGHVIRLDANSYPTRWGAYPIVVQYSAGFAPPPVDVSAAVIRMVTQRYFARQRDPMLKSELVTGIGRTEYATSGSLANMPADVVDLLENYRVPVVG